MFAARRSSLLLARRVVAMPATTRSMSLFRQPAINKLEEILHEYSRNNFNQGLPTNFLTQIINVAHEPDEGMIPAKAAVDALVGIEASSPLTEDEAWEILQTELRVKNRDDQVNEEKFFSIFYDHVKKATK